MAVNGLNSMKQKRLEEMSKDELMEFIDAFEIDGFTKRNSEQSMIEAIEESGKYTGGLKETGSGSIKTEGDKRIHPVFGEYKKCVVHALDGINDLFFSVNGFTFEFDAGTQVHLPKDVIKFIEEECGVSRHFFDKTAVSENGNLGVHKHEIVSNYVVKLLD